LAKKMTRSNKGAKRDSFVDDERLPDFDAVSARFPVPECTAGGLPQAELVEPTSSCNSLISSKVPQKNLEAPFASGNSSITPLASAALLALQTIASTGSQVNKEPSLISVLTEQINQSQSDPQVSNPGMAPMPAEQSLASQLNNILLQSLLQPLVHHWQPPQMPAQPPLLLASSCSNALDPTKAVLDLLAIAEKQRDLAKILEMLSNIQNPMIDVSQTLPVALSPVSLFSNLAHFMVSSRQALPLLSTQRAAVGGGAEVQCSAELAKALAVVQLALSIVASS
jgi:hypothetical protein